MQAILTDPKRTIPVDDRYLGFVITHQDDFFVAIPMGWTGEVLLADTLPQMRRKIWRWWHCL